MGFFDFLADVEHYVDRGAEITRLDLRRDFIVTPFADDIRGGRVLDIASHDGRWSYALAAAGAAEVVGIEGRPELIERFTDFPDDDVRARVRFVEGDLFEELERLGEAGERFDVVALYGIFYHVMDHYRLLRLVARLRPGLVVVDSEWMLHRGPMIRVVLEDTRKILNAIPGEPDQVMAPKGVVSRKAMELMATTLGYRTEWVDWERLPRRRRKEVGDYFRTSPSPNRRGTCVLRPSPAAGPRTPRISHPVGVERP